MFQKGPTLVRRSSGAPARAATFTGRLPGESPGFGSVINCVECLLLFSHPVSVNKTDPNHNPQEKSL